MITRLGLLILIFAITVNADAATIVKVNGRVLDGKGNPVVGARFADYWFAEEAGVLEPIKPSQSGKDGQFSLELEVSDRDLPVMAFDSTGKLGGIGIVRAKSPEDLLEISLAPLVETRVKFASENADRILGRTYVTWSVGGEALRIAGARSNTSEFVIKLPLGRYAVRGSDSRHVEEVREFTLEDGKPADLGEIKLPMTPQAKLWGKPAPAWHVTDARGVSKDVQPGDFKGKWVVLEFWGYWCGPCTARGPPGWMDFVDDHASDSDKFVVLAVHDPKATDFAMLDEKLSPIIRRTWRGQKLPFPILLDTSGKFVEDYGVRSWPTAILLDPQGQVVEVPAKDMMMGSWACEEFLASKLTPLPPERRIARVLDRGLSLSVDEQSLAELMTFYSNVCGTAIHLDADAIQDAGISPETVVPLRVGGTLTLRAWLNMAIEPFGLTYVAEGVAIRVVRRTAENAGLAQPSTRQKAENALVTEALQKKVTFEFKEASLKHVIATLESLTGETFLVDPSCRRLGTINPDQAISGSAEDESLSTALTRILNPAGLAYVVRNEALIFTTAR
jgi:thiol-disulfide isomerase/thioredoxin